MATNHEEATELIIGETYEVKDQLKQMGGRWDAAQKGWRVPLANAAAARELVEANRARKEGERGPSRRSPEGSARGGSLPYGELWQPCACGAEPVCVSCERCSRHCHCG